MTLIMVPRRIGPEKFAARVSTSNGWESPIAEALRSAVTRSCCNTDTSTNEPDVSTHHELGDDSFPFLEISFFRIPLLFWVGKEKSPPTTFGIDYFLRKCFNTKLVYSDSSLVCATELDQHQQLDITCHAIFLFKNCDTGAARLPYPGPLSCYRAQVAQQTSCQSH